MPASKIEKEIQKLESDLRKQKAKLTKLRRKVPLKPVDDYMLVSSQGKSTKLSELFGDRNELILIHNMGKSCPYCALWADGFNGMLKHLESRAAFAVESPDSPSQQKKILAKRGWRFRFVSSQGSTFRGDMGFLDKEGDPYPGVSTFIRNKQGKIFQAASTYFGPGDNFCSTWDLFDLLPKGAGDWEARFNY